ncbi:MAG: hypothetical protein FWC92_02385 [Defluviitaleaceae bacterium]|nr:hypothetical protein [Defluviitaleaceae bacterium]
MKMLAIVRENKTAFVLFVAALAAVVGINIVFFITGGTNLYLFIVLAASFVWLYFQLRMLVKILRRYGIKNPITSRIGKFIGRLAGLLVVFLGSIFAPMIRKLQGIRLPKLRAANRITVFQDEKVRLSSPRKRNPFRPMKWGSLQSHRERIRFIYISFLRQRIKKGAIVLPYETPNELYIKFTSGDDTDAVSQLFALYNTARYADTNTFIQKEEVETVLPCASKRLRLK